MKLSRPLQYITCLLLVFSSFGVNGQSALDIQNRITSDIKTRNSIINATPKSKKKETTQEFKYPGRHGKLPKFNKPVLNSSNRKLRPQKIAKATTNGPGKLKQGRKKF